MIGPMADPLKGAEEDQLCFTVQWLYGGEPVPNVQTDMEFFPRMSYTLEEVVTLVEHTGCGSGRLQGAHMCVRMLEDPADAITDRPVGLYPRPKGPCGPLAVPEPSVAAPGGFHRSADTGRPSDDFQDKPIEPVEDFTKMDTEAMFSPGSSPDDCIADVAHSTHLRSYRSLIMMRCHCAYHGKIHPWRLLQIRSGLTLQNWLEGFMIDF